MQADCVEERDGSKAIHRQGTAFKPARRFSGAQPEIRIRDSYKSPF